MAHEMFFIKDSQFQTAQSMKRQELFYELGRDKHHRERHRVQIKFNGGDWTVCSRFYISRDLEFLGLLRIIAL